MVFSDLNVSYMRKKNVWENRSFAVSYYGRLQERDAPQWLIYLIL